MKPRPGRPVHRIQSTIARTTWIVLLALSLNALAVAVEVPFHPERGLVEVEVLIDGRVKGRFGIDTGADRLYIDRDFAEKNNLSKVGGPPPRQVVGVDGSSDVSWLELRSLKVGKERLYNLRAAAIDLGALIKDTTYGFPDGLLGHELLRRFYVTVDYPRHLLEMQMEEPDIFATKGYVSVPFRTKRHFILVEATFNDSVTADMILDYCASYTVVTPELAARLGAATTIGKRSTIESIRLDDKVLSNGVVVTVRDLVNLRRSASGAMFEGILGASFLHHHKITIDYKRKKIHLHQR